MEDYIRRCDIYCKTKNNRHKLYGLLQSPEVPEKAWQSIALDFITGLPESEEPLTETRYDSIMVINDRLTKYAYMIPFLKKGQRKRIGLHIHEIYPVLTRNTRRNHIGQRQIVYIRILAIPHGFIGNQVQAINGILSANGRSNRKNKPNNGTILTVLCQPSARQLGRITTNGIVRFQQQHSSHRNITILCEL